MTRRITVVTVTFQSAAEIGDALASARVAADRASVELELIVVDNASADRSADLVAKLVPDAVVIRNATNVGFGAANNQAFEVATGDAWLLLNPDARLEPDALQLLLRFYDDHPRAAGVAPAIAGGGARGGSFEPGGAESAGMLPGTASAMLRRGSFGNWLNNWISPAWACFPTTISEVCPSRRCCRNPHGPSGRALRRRAFSG